MDIVNMVLNTAAKHDKVRSVYGTAEAIKTVLDTAREYVRLKRVYDSDKWLDYRSNDWTNHFLDLFRESSEKLHAAVHKLPEKIEGIDEETKGLLEMAKEYVLVSEILVESDWPNWTDEKLEAFHQRYVAAEYAFYPVFDT